MPCQRLIRTTPDWQCTVVIPQSRRGGLWEMHEFVASDEAEGFYTCVSRYDPRSNGSTAWHFSFSDQKTAFAFKMKFG